MFHTGLVALSIALLASLALAEKTHSPNRVDALLDAIRIVETGGANDPAHAVGDGGRSRGWYQISRPYYDEAAPLVPGVPAYEIAVADRTWAGLIVEAYWRRNAPAALRAADLQTLARVHNGGPMGAHKRATVAYWDRVRRVLAAEGVRCAA
jgi:hypothetical protein